MLFSSVTWTGHTVNIFSIHTITKILSFGSTPKLVGHFKVLKKSLWLVEIPVLIWTVSSYNIHIWPRSAYELRWSELIYITLLNCFRNGSGELYHFNVHLVLILFRCWACLIILLCFYGSDWRYYLSVKRSWL